MKVLLVIHGYPPRYNAGSEVYTQTLAQALADRHGVHVFTRQENAFLAEYAMQTESDRADGRVTLRVINIGRGRDRYRHPEVDRRFGNLLDDLDPDVVHIGHLNHLSTSLVLEADRRNIPIMFTLHDYWLMCPRGQFIQMYPRDSSDVWALCDGQEDRKCAVRCYARYYSGAPDEMDGDVEYWTDWTRRRMAHVREMCDAVDYFVAPSMYLLRRFRDEFGLSSEKLTYLDYGFDLRRLSGRRREPGEPFTFGFIGTHIPAKGVNHLIQAFGGIEGDARLRIWGRHQGNETKSLMAFAESLPDHARRGMQWMGEYLNADIVGDVFNQCDAIVVPSIWAENSPLVIHEALQARVPVITADYGGMAEYVRHEENGLLFAHRDPYSLAVQMQRLVDDQDLARRLGLKGYLQSSTGDVPSIGEHVRALEKLYDMALSSRRRVAVI